MNYFDFTDKVFLITGASSGIGKQTAITISENNGTVFITGRNKERLDETFKQLKGDKHQSFIADLTKQEQIDNLVEALPKLNGIVYCAGITGPIPARFINQDKIDKMFKINYEAPVKITAAILAKKKIFNNASIIFMSSISTKYPYIGGSLYIGSKSAIEAFTKVLSLELAPRGIRCNCLSPAYIKTPMLEQTINIVSKDFIEKHKSIQPLGLGKPEDVANVIMFFMSDASKYVTGTNLILGGG